MGLEALAASRERGVGRRRRDGAGQEGTWQAAVWEKWRLPAPPLNLQNKYDTQGVFKALWWKRGVRCAWGSRPGEGGRMPQELHVTHFPLGSDQKNQLGLGTQKRKDLGTSENFSQDLVTSSFWAGSRSPFLPGVLECLVFCSSKGQDLSASDDRCLKQPPGGAWYQLLEPLAAQCPSLQSLKMEGLWSQDQAPNPAVCW